MTALGPELRRPVRQNPEPQIVGYWRVACIVDKCHWVDCPARFTSRIDAEHHARFLHSKVLNIRTEIIYEPAD